ncbi:MAG: S-adenosylmethionine:tRNA ribosyltransferase-isomerase [Adhaeribacter sp.]
MAVHPRDLKIKDFTYHLPEERIAKFPLPDRAASRLLCYQGGQISDRAFTDLPGLLPPGAMLVFNNTRVVQARLFFRRPTGSIVEVFCLEPVAPYTDMQQAMQQTRQATWKCLVGNAKKWKEEELSLTFPLENQTPGQLVARKGEKTGDAYLVHFSWAPAGLTFADILEKAGNLPLPPYLNRAATETDLQTYQTVYARQQGAVAAPTAGLHFTDQVFGELAARHIPTLELTLHVGAGTFKPVKAAEMAGHDMHGEEIYVEARALRQLLGHLPGPLIAVGTTSLRTLESLYWLGLLLARNPETGPGQLQVPQWLPYEAGEDLAPAAALQVLLDFLSRHQLDHLRANTQVLIAPGYRFRLVKGLVTNFHQPESTLLLLVSALIGQDWHRVYQHALDQGYRFLSYGDSSLLLPQGS